ncbi:YoaK family protein [Tahibacter amnicola]|uniref:DUF1275 domain-containing protein n=1 Tax=Tahibacter amnicola TaxID=2976241 RepID=A0ABY6BAF9_9GAMM|nr:YoaK family protein [Tahibacter amnicola]UXI66840.1 DUF1275 domain-containing protein [Tahibacter amnicola]
MITRLPSWVLSCAWVLAFAAGIINVVGLGSFEHAAVTHLTGSTSLLGMAVADADFPLALHLLLVIGAFFGGTVLSGFIVQDSTLRLGRRYSVVLALEAAALVAAVQLLQRNAMSGIYLAGVACGLQNAMATTFSGTIIRTSHVTGMFTDLGIFLGHFVRGVPVEPRRLRICLVVVSGFFCGGLAGAAGFRTYGPATLYVPAAIAFLLAVAYTVYRTVAQRRDV